MKSIFMKALSVALFLTLLPSTSWGQEPTTENWDFQDLRALPKSPSPFGIDWATKGSERSRTPYESLGIDSISRSDFSGSQEQVADSKIDIELSITLNVGAVLPFIEGIKPGIAGGVTLDVRLSQFVAISPRIAFSKFEAEIDDLVEEEFGLDEDDFSATAVVILPASFTFYLPVNERFEVTTRVGIGVVFISGGDDTAVTFASEISFGAKFDVSEKVFMSVEFGNVIVPEFGVLVSTFLIGVGFEI